jgi:hypothetical protein
MATSSAARTAVRKERQTSTFANAAHGDDDSGSLSHHNIGPNVHKGCAGVHCDLDPARALHDRIR